MKKESDYISLYLKSSTTFEMGKIPIDLWLRMMQKKYMSFIFQTEQRELTVSGSAYHMAFEQGQVFKSEYGSLIKSMSEIKICPDFIRKLIPQSGYEFLFYLVGKKFLNRHGSILRNYCGSKLIERLHGLADGYGKSIELIYGVCALEILSSKLPFSLGCTSLAFGSQHTESGQPLIAYNHDFPLSFGKHLFVRKSFPDNFYASINLSYPPILGCIAGVNEKGLAVSLNHAFATDITHGEDLLITILMQECLDRCATVNQALELIHNTPVSNGSMITLVDKKGNRSVVEFSKTKKMTRHAGSDILYTFNQYLLEDMEENQIPLEAVGKGPLKGLKIHEHSIERLKRYFYLATKEKYSINDIHQIMSDHHGSENGAYHTICRHHQETCDTLFSAILYPNTQEISLIRGYPCRGKYMSYYLNDSKKSHKAA